MLKSHLPAGGNPLDLEVSRLRKTYSTDPVVIDVLVGESPQSTMPSRVFGGGYRIHIFTAAVWMPEDGVVQKKELVLSRAIPNSSSSGYHLDRYSHHRVRVLLSGDQTRAVVLVGVETPECPQELASIAESFSKPFLLDHQRFGLLKLDRGLDFFSGTTTWKGKEVDITLPASGEQLDSTFSTRAESLFDSEADIDRRVSQFLVESIVAEHDLIPSEIGPRINLEGIDLSECDTVEFWYDDDDLWGGHSLVIRLSSDNQLTFEVEG